MIDKLIKNREFKRKVKQAAILLENDGRESSFLAVRVNGRLEFGNVAPGDCCEGMPDRGFEERFRDLSHYDDNVISSEGTFHFHPEADELLIPSKNDLGYLFSRIENGKVIPPAFKWMVVGRLDAGKIDLLCVSPGTATEADVSEWLSYTVIESYFYSESLQEEINRGLREIGFNVEYRTL